MNVTRRTFIKKDGEIGGVEKEDPKTKGDDSAGAKRSREDVEEPGGEFFETEP